MIDEPRIHHEIEGLVAGHFDGTLDAKQEAKLSKALATSAEAKQYFLSFMRMEGRLHSLGRDGFLRDLDAEAGAQATYDTNGAATQTNPGWLPDTNVRLRRRVFAASSLVVCSAVILILIAGIPWANSVSAESVLRRARTVAAELVDRTYLVVVSHAVARIQESELTISVHDGGCFLVRPVDETFLIGSDGSEFWVTQQSGPVWVTSDSRSLVPKVRRVIPNMWLFGMAASPKEPLLLDMNDVLSLVERRHNVELIDSGNPEEHHLRATLKPSRRGAPRNAPDRIDFWADAKSGVGLLAEVQWADGKHLRFEPLNSEPLSDHLYHYSGHVPEREIRRLPKRGP